MKIPNRKKWDIPSIKAKVEKKFPQFEVSERWNIFGKYVMVRKTPTIGAVVRVRGENIVIIGIIPNLALRFLMLGLLPYLFLRKGFNEMEETLKKFLK